MTLPEEHGSCENEFHQKKFIERVYSGKVRPFCRIGIAFAGLLLWFMVQGILSLSLGFIENDILNISVAGFLALAILLPLWRLVPGVTPISGADNSSIVAAVTFILFCPFLVIPFFTGLEYIGFNFGWFQFAMALLLLAANEEVICRGFILDALSFKGKRIVGLLFSSVVFAYLHISNDCASVTGILNIFLVGVLFGLIRFLSNGLVYPILIHWLWNLITGMVFGWSVSGHTMLPSLFRPVLRPPWGGFGPEESILMTIAIACCLVVIWRKVFLSGNRSLISVR
ncbi:MAG: CPBP family intramembrane metalloprotease [Candidatus Aegiribacteria sp.]|nr:CPBP family intramembrane metalloprotease [Candidatus Aegiribacteria sp.]